MTDSSDEELDVVELRQHRRPANRGHRGDVGGQNGGLSSRRDAVRRPMTSYTLPRSRQWNRCAIFVDDSDDDQRTMSENIPHDDVTSTVNNASADSDDLFDEFSDFSSDDDPYQNMVSDAVISTLLSGPHNCDKSKIKLQ